MTVMVEQTVTETRAERYQVLDAEVELREEWDTYVEQHPDGTLYHLYGWRDVLTNTFGYRSYYLTALQNDRIVGVLPLHVVRDVLGRSYLVSNPFSNFCGICSNGEEVTKALLDRVEEICRKERAQYAELRQLRHPLTASVGDDPLPTKESFVTLELNLEDGAERIWKDLSSRNRGKARKGEKAGLTTDFGMKYLDDFYRIFCRNLHRLGTPAFPMQFFENVLADFPGRVDLLVLKKDEEVVAGMFLFGFGAMLSEPWVASLSQYNKIYVNNLLYWRAIEHAAAEGYTKFDFGRSTVDSGTFNFKAQWGARPVQLYYHYLLHRSKTVPVVDAHNNRYEKVIDIWKKLPTTLVNVVGPRVVKYLPEL